MSSIISFLKTAKEFFIKHPAVLSGYIIYAYFFISTMDFYRSFKATHFRALDYIKSFDALLWMWGLAFVLVKVIQYRTKLVEQEKVQLQHQKELEVKETQLKTMNEVLRALHHELNNPLTIILLYIYKAEKNSQLSPEILQTLSVVKENADRIAKILKDFSNARGYETVESPAGRLAKPQAEP